MYAGKGAARLLMVAAFAVAVADAARRPRSKPGRVYRPNKDAVKLLNYVMMHEEDWMDVLKEPIKMPDEPPYTDRTFDPPLLVPMERDVTLASYGEYNLYDVRQIVATITRHYVAIRSIVEYGAKALRHALACYTYKQVYFQVRGILHLITRNADWSKFTDTAYLLKKTTSKYIDLLSAVPDNDLTLILDYYWKSIKLLQHKKVESTEEPLYPKYLIDFVKSIRNKTSKYLKSHCAPFKSENEYFQTMGIEEEAPLLTDIYLESTIPNTKMFNMIIEEVEKISHNAQALSINTMTDHTWLSLFYYRDQPRTDSTKLVKAHPSTSETKPKSQDEYTPPPPENV